ncbi:MAG: hypothetical protein O2923_00240 [Verrucomicrobia bacterium]|nr:hypothetical protein [Verrucomicrobiota bacterium]MDA1085564.1 hypothetical protein [Verrucomicrobiota bacterium]
MSDFRLDILDGIIPVVAVIIWIVSSMMKVAKKGQRPGRSDPMMPQEPAPSGDPEEQLRRFLQGLSGAAGQQAPGPPPVFEEEEEMEAPLRVVPPPPPPIRVVAATPRDQAAPSAYDRVERTVAAPRSAAEARDPLAQESMRPVASRRSQPARRWLRRHLDTAESVRNAVILREVLGPPLGMRKQGD